MGVKNEVIERESITAYWADEICRDSEMKSKALYLEKIESILAQAADFEKDGKALRLGLETEFSLITKDSAQATELDRNQVIDSAGKNSGSAEELFGKEMGAAQLEYRTPTPPGDLLQEGFAGLEKKVNELEVLLRKATQEHGVRLVRSGTNPFVPVDEIQRTSLPKYRMVPDFHDRYKRFPNGSHDTRLGSRESIEVQGADIIGITQAVQFSIDTMGFTDAIDKINRSLMVSPYICALCSNARFLDAKDSGFSDIRMLAWEISHDIRTADDLIVGNPYRIGFPDSYYLSIEHYFDRVGSFPFILHPDSPEEAFAVATGIYWNDARIKFNFRNSQAIIEFRPISTQPSVKEDMAAAAYYVGRLVWSQKSGERMLDLGLVRENRYAAMKKGLEAELWWIDEDGRIEKRDARSILPQELRRAAAGLEMLGLLDETSTEYFTILNRRITEGTPADCLAALVDQAVANGKPKAEALVSAMGELDMLIG